MKRITLALLIAAAGCALGDSQNPSITAHNAATTLPNPPTAWADVRHWTNARNLVLDYEVWGDAAVSITGLELLGAVQKDAPNIADDDANAVTNAADTWTVTGHAFKNGDGPFRLTTTGTLPAPLLTATDYWFTVVDANTIKFHASFNNWIAGVAAIDLTSDGTGTQTIADVTSGAGATMRVHWFSYGSLGPLGDGAVALDAQKGFASRVAHRPKTIAYAFTASAVSAATTIEVMLSRPGQ